MPYIQIMDLEELHQKKVINIIDEKQKWNLPIAEKDADIKDILSILSGRDHVWIVEKKGSRRLCGVVTENDVLRLLAPSRLPKYMFGKRYSISFLHGTAKKAKDIMNKHIIKCSPEDSVGDALMRMVNAGLRRLPVVENDEIIGEITTHYIIQILLGKR
ncbi:MAG TPA: CBS domain-containing protein [Thermoplasmatales archaeon]|nr:CBS domain-containing protein [Thermoplasmatales archaeon]